MYHTLGRNTILFCKNRAKTGKKVKKTAETAPNMVYLQTEELYLRLRAQTLRGNGDI